MIIKNIKKIYYNIKFIFLLNCLILKKKNIFNFVWYLFFLGEKNIIRNKNIWNKIRNIIFKIKFKEITLS